MKSTSKSRLGELVLLLITVIWGSAFVVVKNTISEIPPNYVIAIRFLMAFLLLVIFLFPKLKKLNRHYIIGGLLIAIPGYLGYYTQTIGLKYTTAGNSAFLTSIYVILVPFIYWRIRRKRPNIYNVSAAIMCLIGIGFISLQNNLSINYGDILNIISGVTFAFQIVIISILTEKYDPILICVSQFFFTGFFALIVALFTEQLPASWSSDSVFSLLYIGIFSTAIALVLQNVCQKYVAASKASLIMSLESVFGCLFGALLLHEKLPPKTVIGFILVLVAMIVSETQLSFFKSSKKPLAESKADENE